MGLATADAWFPVSGVLLQSGGLICVCCLPYYYGVLWNCWLSTVVATESRLQVPPLLFSQFHLLYLFQSTYVQMYRCVDLSRILVCWTRGIFVEL